MGTNYFTTHMVIIPLIRDILKHFSQLFQELPRELPRGKCKTPRGNFMWRSFRHGRKNVVSYHYHAKENCEYEKNRIYRYRCYGKIHDP